MTKVKGSALFWVIDSVLFLGLWFLYTSTLKVPELLAGMGAAALAAAGSVVMQQERFAQFAPKFKWLLLFLAEPWYVLTGSSSIIWAVLRRLAGRRSKAQLRAIPFDAGSNDQHSAARRALAVTLTTIPPNFIVIGIDRARNLMLIHQVSPSDTPWVTKQLGGAA